MLLEALELATDLELIGAVIDASKDLWHSHSVIELRSVSLLLLIDSWSNVGLVELFTGFIFFYLNCPGPFKVLIVAGL